MALTLPGRRGGVAMERAKERGRAVLAWSDFFLRVCSAGVDDYPQLAHTSRDCIGHR